MVCYIAGASVTFPTKMVNYLLDCFSQVLGVLCDVFNAGGRCAYPAYKTVGPRQRSAAGQSGTAVIYCSSAQSTPEFRAGCSAPGSLGAHG